MTYNKSIKSIVAIKLLVVFAIFAVLLFIILPIGLKNYFIEEAYRTIEISQEASIFSNDSTSIDPRTVNHIFISKENNMYRILTHSNDLDPDFLTQAIKFLNSQQEEKQRYVYEEHDKTIYFVINKSNDRAIISFVLTNYVDYYIKTLFWQLTIIFIFLFSFSFITTILVSHNITRPLISVSNKIKNISNNNWDEEIPITRRDEIGHIEASLEELRTTLKTKERIQQEMFQNISHDLKTPIMIIEGYSQLVLDGFVPSEELNDTMHSIMEEAKRLENKVKSLLYINKIDQLYADKKVFDEVDLEELIVTVVNPFKKQFVHLNFIIDIKTPDLINGLFDEWRVALENIIDNMTRFAKTTINITCSEETISIKNDGEPIDDKIIEKIFDAYSVGNRSNFGLGLAITKKIVTTFGYEISAHNTESGVEFIIKKVYKQTE